MHHNRIVAFLRQRPEVLLLDDAARNTVAGVTRRIRHQVILLGVNHNRRSAVVKERIRAFSERGALCNEPHTRYAVRTDYEVQEVADVRMRLHRAVEAVVSAGRVEMAADQIRIGINT